MTISIIRTTVITIFIITIPNVRCDSVLAASVKLVKNLYHSMVSMCSTSSGRLLCCSSLNNFWVILVRSFGEIGTINRGSRALTGSMPTSTVCRICASDIAAPPAKNCEYHRRMEFKIVLAPPSCGEQRPRGKQQQGEHRGVVGGPIRVR